jgi:riboflavin biosynthesis pyrimidine reductase
MNYLSDALAWLGQFTGPSITHLLVEPGPTLAQSFLDDNLADRLWVFQSPRRLNDPTAPAAAAIPPGFIPTGQLTLAGDTLTEYLNTGSPVFFANTPSADWVLTQPSDQ